MTNNPALQRIVDAVRARQRFVLSSHARPDGDSIGSLRRFKDDVSEVKSGFECGIGFEKYNDIKVGDVIEVFAMERVAITA